VLPGRLALTPPSSLRAARQAAFRARSRKALSDSAAPPVAFDGGRTPGGAAAFHRRDHPFPRARFRPAILPIAGTIGFSRPPVAKMAPAADFNLPEAAIDPDRQISSRSTVRAKDCSLPFRPLVPEVQEWRPSGRGWCPTPSM